MSATILQKTLNLSTCLSFAYDKLTTLTQEVQAAELQLSKARVALVTERAEILLTHADDPKALGANEAAREAKLASLTATARDVVAECDAVATAAKNNLQLQGIVVEGLRAQLRCLEVAAAVGGRDGS